MRRHALISLIAVVLAFGAAERVRAADEKPAPQAKRPADKVVMDAATKNANEMIGSLSLQYNRARQAAITKELMEIVSGAEALK